MPLQTLHVHLGRLDVQRETLPADVERRFLGGRGAASWLLATRMAPGTPPASADNLLILAAGPLGGTGCFASDGFVATTRSPLTGSIAHSWAPGHWGGALRTAGYDLLALSGQAAEWSVLLIDGPQVSLKPARRMLGMSTVETDIALREALGDDMVTLCLGPAGEAGVAYASIVAEGRFSAEPAGPGAVMAAKRLKAIAVRQGQARTMADRHRATAILAAITARSQASALAEQIRQFGSTFYANPASEWGALTGRNGQDGRLGHVLAISRATLALRGRLQVRGCRGCPMPCFGDYVHRSGRLLPRPELELIAGFGARCSVDSPDALIAISDLCLHHGLDPTATAAAVAFLTECQQLGLTGGTLDWSDEPAILAAIERLGQRQEKRDVLSLGVGEMQAIFFGSAAFAPQVKGLASPGLDPRALQEIALATATAPIGGDFRYAMTYDELLDNPPDWLPDEPSHPQAVKGKVPRVIWHERFAAALDSAGMCRRLALMGYQVTPAELTELVNAVTGQARSPGELARLGERVVTLERLYMLREAVDPKDGLPARWSDQPLREGRAAGHLPQLSDLLPEYYRRHGWDAHGRPTPERLAELELP